MSLKDEIRSLREELAEKGARIATFDGRSTRLRAERDVARAEVAKLAERLGKANADLKELRAKLSDQEKKIERQATTIKVQSEQIAGPREVNITPRRNAGLTPRASTYAQPPPAYNQPSTIYSQPPPVYGLAPQVYHQPPQVHNQPPQIQITPTSNIGPQHFESSVAHPHSSSIVRASSSLQPPAFVSAVPRLSPFPQTGSFTPSQNLWSPNAGGSSFQAPAFAPPRSERSPLPPQGSFMPSQSNWTPNPSSTLIIPEDSRLKRLLQPSPRNSLSHGTMVPYQPPRHPNIMPESLTNSFNRALGWSDEPASTLAEYNLSLSISDLKAQGEDEYQVVWSNQVSQLFNATEKWAHSYANVPDHNRDKALGPGLMAAFTRQVEPGNIEPLLASKATRYFMIARGLNTWITGDVLSTKVFKPFRPQVDETANRVKSATKTKPTPNIVKALLYDLSMEAKGMRDTPGFEKWLIHQAHWKCRSIWTQVRELVIPGIQEPQARDDLTHLLMRSYCLSVLMVIHPLAHNMNFPQFGRGSFFNPESMINRDSEYKGNAKSLALQGLRVRLGITPCIMVIDLASNSCNPSTYHHGQVLLQR